MASIDYVTTSFTASLAIAGGSGPLDLGKLSGGTVRRSSQRFLLGKILNKKPSDPSLFKSHFQHIWILEKKVKVQEKGEHLLFSFESLRDKNKVLRGGAWSFDKAPVILEDYDGIVPMTTVPMRHVRYWVKIEGIPPAFEEPENVKLICDLLGGFLDLDKPLFKQGVVRIFLQHDVSKPIFLSRVVRLAEGVEPLLRFTFEHLVGRCKRCSLISHVGEPCSMLVGDVLDDPSSFKLPGFGSTDLVSSASFVFASQVPRAISSSLFHHVSPLPMVKEKRAIVIRNLGMAPVPNLEELAVFAIQSVLGKRSLDVGAASSPKKLKMAVSLRRTTLEAAALGFQVTHQEQVEVPVKHKRGRPVGAKNKKEKVVKKTGMEPLRLTYLVSSFAIPCPTAKSKEKA